MDTDFDTSVSPQKDTQDSQGTTTTTDDRALSPEVKQILDSFETKSPARQLEVLKNLEGATARPAQREAATLIRELYSFEEPSAHVSVDQTDSEIAKQLAEMRQIKAEIEAAKQETLREREGTTKEKTIRDYLKSHKIDADIEDVLGDRQFVKAFLENKDLSMDKRVKLAMVDTYGGNTDWLSNRKNTTAIGKSSSSGSSFKQPKGLKELGKVNLDEWARSRGL